MTGQPKVSSSAWNTGTGSEAELEPDSVELRLESDDDLVRIVTLHKSKGLEYDVVIHSDIRISSFSPQQLESISKLVEQHGGDVVAQQRDVVLAPLGQVVGIRPQHAR